MAEANSSIYINSPIDKSLIPECLEELQFLNNAVSGQNICQSVKAERLCFFDLSERLKIKATYDIGGTYTDKESDLWFYYTTTQCPGYRYLLNIFAYHRKIGTFSLGISDAIEINSKFKLYRNINDPTNNPRHALLTEKLTWKTFLSAKADVSHYIETYCFDENSLVFLQNKFLWIPISIQLNEKELLRGIEKEIKLNHAITIGSISKRNNTDFILESITRKQYPTHKILLLGHSPVLRDMIRNSNTNSAFIDVSDEGMECLIEYIHTGTIKDIEKDLVPEILDVAVKFKFKRLEDLMVEALK